PNVFVGLVVVSENIAATSTSVFDNVQILPAVLQASHLDVSVASGAVNRGEPFSVTVTALDPYNNPVPGYRGTVHFTSSLPGATLPPDYTSTADDNGRHTFTVTLTRHDPTTITVIDSATTAIRGGTVVTVISQSVASSLLVASFPSGITA